MIVTFFVVCASRCVVNASAARTVKIYDNLNFMTSAGNVVYEKRPVQVAAVVAIGEEDPSRKMATPPGIRRTVMA